jgi:hypothetical protein
MPKSPARIYPAGLSSLREFFEKQLELGHPFSLLALWSLDQFELDCLTFVERLESLTLDSGVVHEHIPAFGLFNKAITLAVIEPFHFSLFLFCHGEKYPPELI